MARWQRAEFFSGWRFVWTLECAEFVSQSHHRHDLLMGLHSLGVLFPADDGRTCVGPAWLRHRGRVSFSGIPIFRTQSLFLGMDSQLPRDCLLLCSVVSFSNQRHTQQKQGDTSTGSEHGVNQSRQTARRKNPSIAAIEPSQRRTAAGQYLHRIGT